MEAPDRFRAIQTYRAGMAIIAQQRQLIVRMYNTAVLTENEQEIMEEVCCDYALINKIDCICMHGVSISLRAIDAAGSRLQGACAVGEGSSLGATLHLCISPSPTLLRRITGCAVPGDHSGGAASHLQQSSICLHVSVVALDSGFVWESLHSLVHAIETGALYTAPTSTFYRVISTYIFVSSNVRARTK